MQAVKPPGEVILQGVGVSPGMAIGAVWLLNTDDDRHVERSIEEDEIGREIARFEDALLETRQQVRAIQQRVAEAIGHEHAAIFDAHLLVVDDRSFIEEVLRELETRRINIEAVVGLVTRQYAAALARINDDYLRERAADVMDVGRRIVRNLAGHHPSTLANIKEPRLVVANDLSPSDTAAMDRERVLGFATDLGSATSHTAIMARALEIPAVVGLHDISTRVSDGDLLLLDGNKGLLVIHPTDQRLAMYGRIASTQQEIRSRLTRLRDLEAETIDGHRVVVSANIELASDVAAVKKYGGKGIGLFRTEYLYLAAEDMPDEDRQLQTYREVLQALTPDPVVFRTLDLGGDKFTSSIKSVSELNPFMGWRGIRFCLARRDIFKTQLRALLRAGANGRMRLMYPMVSHLDEVLEANAILREAMQELRIENHPHCTTVDVGVMIEVPSAALTADLIAPHVGFFSLGTNDLVQYTLAVDRVNERVAYLYQPTHPAIIKLIAQTATTAKRFGIHTSVCGEMAGNPILVPLLLGLGIRELSVSPNMIPLVKRVVRSLRFGQAETLAREALEERDGETIFKNSRNLVNTSAPEVLALIE